MGLIGLVCDNSIHQMFFFTYDDDIAFPGSALGAGVHRRLPHPSSTRLVRRKFPWWLIRLDQATGAWQGRPSCAASGVSLVNRQASAESSIESWAGPPVGRQMIIPHCKLDEAPLQSGCRGGRQHRDHQVLRVAPHHCDPRDLRGAPQRDPHEGYLGKTPSGRAGFKGSGGQSRLTFISEKNTFWENPKHVLRPFT